MEQKTSFKISIIGAGIGGLTTGIALHQKGFNTEIFEAASLLKPVGAGIILAPNAMKVYKHLGLYDEILAAGNKLNDLNITDHLLKPVMKNSLKAWENETGISAVAVSRSNLQEILLSAFDSKRVNLNKKVKTYYSTNKKVEVKFEDSTELYADVLIGADGINSAIRRKMFPEINLRQAGQWCWRGVCDSKLPDEFSSGLFELWGAGARFGFVQINSSQVYWYALTNKNIISKDLTLTALKVLFNRFHPVVSKLLAQTEGGSVIHGAIQDIRPLNTWFNNNVCLIGDAAHPTTPNLGQGACQAIEDAYLLAEMFASENSVPECFAKFNALRKTKAEFVVNASWRLGKMAQLNSPLLCNVRNFMLRLMPSSANDKTNKMVYTVDYTEHGKRRRAMDEI